MISNKDEGEINPPRVNAHTTKSSQEIIAVEDSLVANNVSKSIVENEKAARQASEGLPAKQPLPKPVSRRVKYLSRIPRPICGREFVSSIRVNAHTTKSSQDMIAVEASLAANNVSKSIAEDKKAARQPFEGLPAKQPLLKPVPQCVKYLSRIPRPIRGLGFVSSTRVNAHTKESSQGMPLPKPVPLSVKNLSCIPRLVRDRGFVSSTSVVELAPLSAREAVAPIESLDHRRVNTARIAQQRPMIGKPRTVEEPNVFEINERLKLASLLPLPGSYYGTVSTSSSNWSRKQTVNIGSSTGMIARQSEEVRDNVQEDEIDDISKAVQQAKETASSSDEDEDFHSLVSSEDSF